MSLEQLRQVVAQDRQAQRRLGAPELLQAQFGQREVGVQLLDDLLASGPRIIL